MDSIIEQAIAQLLALITFFAFPVIQYFWLKIITRKEGELQLWYLPAYGFRLVARNLPRKKAYTGIKYRTMARGFAPSRDGSSVGTWLDETLLDREDYFLFPGNDQLIFCFKIEGQDSNNLMLVHTDNLGQSVKKKIAFSDFQRLVFDFHANMENLFNFDVQVARRGEITVKDLTNIWLQIQAQDVEGRFELSRIRAIS